MAIKQEEGWLERKFSILQPDAKYKRIYNGEPQKVMEEACKTAGISLEYISKILTERSGTFDDLNSITVGDWFYLCSLLQLDIDSLSFGYSSYTHCRCIGEALYRGDYQLPNTKEIKEIWKFFKVEMKKQRKSELRNYGGRLKRKIRISYLKDDFQFFFSRHLEKLHINANCRGQEHLL